MKTKAGHLMSHAHCFSEQKNEGKEKWVDQGDTGVCLLSLIPHLCTATPGTAA